MSMALKQYAATPPLRSVDMLRSIAGYCTEKEVNCCRRVARVWNRACTIEVTGRCCSRSLDVYRNRYLPKLAVQKGNWQLSINDGNKILVKRGEEEYTLQNACALMQIAVDECFVFALRSDGKVVQWDYRTGTAVQIAETDYSINLTYMNRFRGTAHSPTLAITRPEQVAIELDERGVLVQFQSAASLLQRPDLTRLRPFEARKSDFFKLGIGDLISRHYGGNLFSLSSSGMLNWYSVRGNLEGSLQLVNPHTAHPRELLIRDNRFYAEIGRTLFIGEYQYVRYWKNTFRVIHEIALQPHEHLLLGMGNLLFTMRKVNDRFHILLYHLETRAVVRTIADAFDPIKGFKPGVLNQMTALCLKPPAAHGQGAAPGAAA